MKFSAIIFIGIVFLIALKYTKVIDINLFWIVGALGFWFLVVYIQIHFKNRERETPKPVYITNQ